MVDTVMLKRHAVSFTVFMGTSIFLAIVLLILGIYPEKTWSENCYQCALLLESLGELISSVVLCRILWEWGTYSTPDKAVKNIEVYPEI